MRTHSKNERNRLSKSVAPASTAGVDVGLILDSLGEAIVTFDGAGIVSYVNKPLCEMFGYKRADVTGSLLTLLLPGIARRASMSLPAKIKLIGIRSDSSQFPVHLHLRVVARESITDKERSYVGVVRDIKPRRDERERLNALKEEIDRASRLRVLVELSSHISHEINQPLTAVVLYAQACERLLTQGLNEGELLGDALQKLSAQALRAGRVNERVQRYVSSSRTYPKRQGINALLMAIKPLATADAADRNIDLIYRLAPDLPDVNCRATNVYQITMNLLRNAYEAMADAQEVIERTVVLRTERATLGEIQSVNILVEDQGAGIAPEFSAIFSQSTPDRGSENAFARIHSTGNRAGLGLGLLISQSLLAEDGGTLNFANSFPRGCTVWFSLPVADNNSEPIN